MPNKMKAFSTFDMTLLLFCFLSVSKAQSNFTDDAKSSFKFRFVQGYALRTGLNLTDKSQPISPLQLLNTPKKNGIDWAKSQEWLDEAIEGYETLMDEKELAEVTIKGNTEEMLHFAADKVWERTGGAFVDEVSSLIGTVSGAFAGEYLGGLTGIAFGIFFPEIEVPLVIGGVFMGSNLGRAIGLVGGKVIGDIVNELIEHEIIEPASDQVMNEILGEWFIDQSNSTNVTCRSDICGKGSRENSCKCEPCSGKLEYQDLSG